MPSTKVYTGSAPRTEMCEQSEPTVSTRGGGIELRLRCDRSFCWPSSGQADVVEDVFRGGRGSRHELRLEYHGGIYRGLSQLLRAGYPAESKKKKISESTPKLT